MMYDVIMLHYVRSVSRAPIGLAWLAFTAQTQHQAPTGSVAPEMRLPPLILCELQDSSLSVCCYGNTVGQWQRGGEEEGILGNFLFNGGRIYENERQRGWREIK